MVADILEMNGWDSRFLGATTNASSLIHSLQEVRPHLLCLSLSTQMAFSELLATIRQVRGPFPDLPIAVGGQAFRWGGVEQLDSFGNVHYVSSLTRLEELIKS